MPTIISNLFLYFYFVVFNNKISSRPFNECVCVLCAFVPSNRLTLQQTPPWGVKGVSGRGEGAVCLSLS